jgi:hypothetical protein
MLTYNDVLIHESLIMAQMKTPDDNPTEAELKTREFFSELKKAFPPIKICGQCPDWEQTDTLTPAAGRCRRLQKSGRNVVMFNYEECPLTPQCQGAA